MNADNAAKARLGKLKKKADELGILYQEDVTEDILKQAIKDTVPPTPQATPQATPQVAPEVTQSGGFDAKALGDAIGSQMGKAMMGLKDVIREKGDDDSVTEAEIDPEDIVAPKTYFCPMLFWIAPAKRIAGQLVKAPIKRIVFNLDRGSAVQVGTQWQTRYISTYISNNRKEQAWLETHPLFKRVFFKSEADTAVSSDQIKFAKAFGRHIDALNYTMAPELYRLGEELSVRMDHTMSLAAMRTVLADALAKRDMTAEDANLRRLLTESGQKDLLQKQAMP
jgi:hypothetical protein